MSVTSNYSGRTVDLLIFQNTAPSGRRSITLGLGGATGGFVTTGVQKLSQMWSIFFLTELGSVPSSLALGTNFLFALRTGAIQDESDVKTEFSMAANLVFSQLRAREAASDLPVPDDEKIRAAALLGFSLNKSNSTLTLLVGLTSQAGTTREIFLPVPAPIQ